MYPSSDLISDGTFLYGTTRNGGTNDNGIIFKIRPDGTEYTKLLDFDGFVGNVNGVQPWGSLIFDGTFLYGMTTGGGANNSGTIFKIRPDGSGYIKLLDFNITNGQYPYGSLISDGAFLYGMTLQGGTNGFGTIFKIMADGTGFAKLLDFGSANGRHPYGSLVSDALFLYGMSGDGVSSGVIFKIKHDGTGYVKLKDFAGAPDGSDPRGSLLSDGVFLYGMTLSGGTGGVGTIFKIKLDGTGYTKLHDFSNIASNGSSPYGSLIFDGTFLYGMTSAGGLNAFGTIFKIKPDGTEYGKLLDFAGVPEGRQPLASLFLDGTFLYGVTLTGGINSRGTIFKYSLSPTALPTITSFTPPSGSVGATVIITGTNFSTTPADNAVHFNGTLATVTASSAASITTTVPAGASTGTITVTVAGNTATSGSNFIVTAPSIIITTQPSDDSTCAGEIATFTSVASGTINITYQWQFAAVLAGPYTDIADGGGYSNATASALSVNTAGNFGAGNYRCKVSGDLDTDKFSNAVTLTVNNIPAAPTVVSTTACPPSSVTLTASGGIDGEYRWYTAASGGTSIAGELNSTYVTSSLSIATAYYVTIDNGICESVRKEVLANIVACADNLPPSIMPASVIAQVAGKVTLNLKSLISDRDNNLDLSTLKIIILPESKAVASIDSEANLTIDYTGISFRGKDHLTIEACDLAGSCTQQEITIEVEGDIVVHNAISPNGDRKNDTWIIKNIDLLQDTRFNHVTIFNRWGDAVFETDNYDNLNRQFSGQNKNGSELPAGTYFYKIEFASGRKSLTGYISLKR